MNLISAKFYSTLWIMYFVKLSMTVVYFMMSHNLANTNVALTRRFSLYMTKDLYDAPKTLESKDIYQLVQNVPISI